MPRGNTFVESRSRVSALENQDRDLHLRDFSVDFNPEIVVTPDFSFKISKFPVDLIPSYPTIGLIN